MKNLMIIFDFDKTLADAGELQRIASKEVCRPYNTDIDETSLKDYGGNTQYEVVKRLLKLTYQQKGIAIEPEDIEVIAGVERWKEKLTSILEKEKPKVYYGVHELLSLLEKKAILGLVTGNPKQSGTLLLEKAGLDKYFPHHLRVFSDEFPHGDRVYGIEKCLNNAGSCNRVIYMGDNRRDLENGYRSKAKFQVEVKVAIVNHEGIPAGDISIEGKEPDFFFDNFKDYKKIARTLLRR